MSSLIGLTAIVLGFLLGMSNWRRAIPYLLYWTLIEGAFRKWFFPSAEQWFFFVGPALIIGAYIRFFSDRRKRLPKHLIEQPLTFLLLFYFIIALAQVFNPSLPTPLMGMVALMTHFTYVPMAYMIPFVFSSSSEWWKFASRYVYALVPLGAIAAMQIISPPSSFINAEVRSELPTFGGLDVVTGTLLVRVSGTFATFGYFNQQLMVMAVLVLGLIGLKQYRERLPVFMLLLLITLLSSLGTASRGSVLVVAAAVVVFLFQMLRSRDIHVGYVIAFPLLFVVLVLLIRNWEIGRLAWTSIFYRFTESGDTASRFLDPWTPWRVWDYVGFAGHGIGITYGGSQSLSTSPISFPVLIHYEPERMLYELGPVGFLLVYGIRFLVFGKTIILLRRSTSQMQRYILLGALIVQVRVLYLSQMTYQPLYSRWWWFMLGLVFLVEQEVRSEVSKPQHTRLHTGDAPQYGYDQLTTDIVKTGM